MNNDAGKHTRTWKKVVQYVVHLLAILVTFLPIVIITVLTLGWVSGETKLIIGIPDTIITVTIIILMYLIPFLLNARGFLQSLSKIKRNIREVSWPTSLKETFTESLKLAAYPVHFALRLAARFVLLAILVPFLLFLILIGISIFLVLALVWGSGVLGLSEVFSINELIIQYANVIGIITLLITIGLIWFLTREFKKDIKKSLSGIKEKLGKAFRGRWLPGMNIKESLLATWRCYVAKVWPYVKEMFTESKKLFVAALILCIILLCNYIVKQGLRGGNNKDLTKVMDKLKDIECKVDSIAIPDPKAWRDNVTTKLDDIRTDTADLIILRSSGYSPAYLSEKGTRISLGYPPQGNLRSKKGICPEGDNLIWLKLFKKAFSAKCSNEEGRVRLKVQGFASIAPVTVNGDSMSNQLNCEIANERAEALIYFLKLADTIQYTTKGCKATLDDSLIWKGRAKSDSIWKAPGFDVTYKPWPSYAEMDSAKPAQDSRRPDLEFLNRTVQIIIEDGGCLTKPVDNAGNSD